MSRPRPASRRLRSDAVVDVVGIGSSSVDHLCVVRRHPRLDSKQEMAAYDVQPGGQVPTALVALQRWGLRTALLAAFGDDPGARMVRDALAAEGVDLSSAIERPGVRQQAAVILVDEVTGERSVLCEPAPKLRLAAGELDLAAACRGRVLLLDAVDLPAATAAAKAARAAGALTVLDIDAPGPGVEALLRHTDVLIAGVDFFARLTGIDDPERAARAAARLGPWFTAVTLGPGGALAWVDGARHFVPAFRVQVVDSTGAGDIFHAACILGIVRGWDAETTLRFAAAAAALKCEKLGGRPGIPALEQACALAGTG